MIDYLVGQRQVDDDAGIGLQEGREDGLQGGDPKVTEELTRMSPSGLALPCARSCSVSSIWETSDRLRS